jgi:hypothetical protein
LICSPPKIRSRQAIGIRKLLQSSETKKFSQSAPLSCLNSRLLKFRLTYSARHCHRNKFFYWPWSRFLSFTVTVQSKNYKSFSQVNQYKC